MSQPIITPGKFLGRESLPPELAGCSLAVVGFCRFYDMKQKLSAEPLAESLFSHLGRQHQYIIKLYRFTLLYGKLVIAVVGNLYISAK